MKKNLLKFYSTIFITLMSFLANADPIDPPADTDPPPAPINEQIIWLAITGIVFAFYIINKKKISLTK